MNHFYHWIGWKRQKLIVWMKESGLKRSLAIWNNWLELSWHIIVTNVKFCTLVCQIIHIHQDYRRHVFKSIVCGDLVICNITVTAMFPVTIPPKFRCWNLMASMLALICEPLGLFRLWGTFSSLIRLILYKRGFTHHAICRLLVHTSAIQRHKLSSLWRLQRSPDNWTCQWLYLGIYSLQNLRNKFIWFIKYLVSDFSVMAVQAD